MKHAAIVTMKKILVLGCLILITACQPATPTPVAPLFPSATLPASPTPVAFTATPELMSTPELTATPFPRLFTDEFDASLAGWVILQAGSAAVPSVKNENSHLILHMDAPYTWTYAVYGAQDYENVRVDAQFTNQAGSPASIGLICRYSEETGWFEYNVSTDGTYNLLYGQWLSTGVADYLPIVTNASKTIQPSGVAQEIGLTCSGTTLSLYVNQTLIRNIDVSRFELTQGKVGITASSFENTPVSAAFNWVRVSEP